MANKSKGNIIAQEDSWARISTSFFELVLVIKVKYINLIE